MRIQTTTQRTASSLNSHDLRHGLVESLQPLHTRFPLIVPKQPLHQMMPIEQPSIPYSLGLQPCRPDGNVPMASMTPRDIQTRSLLLAASIAPPISCLKVLLTFIAGGLFFSTAVAGVGACYTMGMDNVKRIMEILFVVLQRVWLTFSLGMGYTKLALTGEEADLVGPKKRHSWRWKPAWRALKAQLKETRRTAAQGVKALRQEATLYSAAVGPPGLVPLQHIVNRLMPFSLTSMLEDAFRESLEGMPSQTTIKKMSLSSFNGGTCAPTLEAARVFDVDGAIAMDYDVKWQSDIEATVELTTFGGIARVPIKLENFSFEGAVRVVLAPMIKHSPGYGATLISLPSPPKMNVNVKVLGSEVTRLPFLRTEITSVMQKAITDELLWPRRNVFPTLDANGKPLLSARQIKALETSDPLLEAEEALAAKQPALFRDVSKVAQGRRIRKEGSNESDDMVQISMPQEKEHRKRADRQELEVVEPATAASKNDLTMVHFDKVHLDSTDRYRDHLEIQQGIMWHSLKTVLRSPISQSKNNNKVIHGAKDGPRWALQEA